LFASELVRTPDQTGARPVLFDEKPSNFGIFTQMGGVKKGWGKTVREIGFFGIFYQIFREGLLSEKKLL
jgi:hypothetical protein